MTLPGIRWWNQTGSYIYDAWVCDSQQGLTFSPLIPGDVGRYEDGRCAICEEVDSRCRWVQVTDSGMRAALTEDR